jgi:hypothetical protein
MYRPAVSMAAWQMITMGRLRSRPNSSQPQESRREVCPMIIGADRSFQLAYEPMLV